MYYTCSGNIRRLDSYTCIIQVPEYWTVLGRRGNTLDVHIFIESQDEYVYMWMHQTILTIILSPATMFANKPPDTCTLYVIPRHNCPCTHIQHSKIYPWYRLWPHSINSVWSPDPLGDRASCQTFLMCELLCLSV